MIETKNLYYKYEDEFVLKSINLHVREDIVTAIIGHNGSGKTTLAKHFNSLLLPSSGNVLIDGIDSRNQKEARMKVGFVFQNFEDQIIHSVVEEDVAFGLENLKMSQKDIWQRVSQTLKKLKIEHLAKENVNSLSIGQRQLVALAGVLAMTPKYIVFDEPTTMLDSKNKKLILDTIKSLKNQSTPILVTNDIGEIKYADDVIVLKTGSVAFSGARKKLSKSVLTEAGL